MAIKNWIQTASGAQDWSVGANWTGGTIPANGDTVNILQGNADISAGLSQSAVTLAAMTVGPGFSGTIADPSNNPLQIGITTGNAVTINSQSSNVSIDFGSTQPAVLVLGTGSPLASTPGSEAFRMRGGGAATTLSVTQQSGASGSGSQISSVGVATDTGGLTATIATLSVAAGTVNVASGVTLTNAYQTGGFLTLYCGAAIMAQTNVGGQLVTFGTAEISAITVLGTATLNHRPASGTDAFQTLVVGSGAIVDFSQEPAALTYLTSITMAFQATLKAFSKGQITCSTGPTPLELATSGQPQSNLFNAPCSIRVS